MSSVEPLLSTAIDLKPTFGWIFIGIIFAAVFYGVTVVQTLFYFQTYPNDRLFLKSIVTGLWILDTLSLILISHAVYTWLVIDFANPLGLNNVIWSIASEPLCTATIALCVHLFMAYRIYILDNKLILLVIFVALLSFVPFGAAIATVVFGLTTPGGFAALNAKLHSAAVIGDIFTASLDIIIATTLVVLLRKHGSQMYQLERTNKMIFTLTIYLVTNNLLTSFITTSGLITFFASPKTLFFEAINVAISKAYTNTFLSQLNARQSIRGRGFISTQGSSAAVKNMEPIAFNLGPMTETNEEFDFQMPNPAISITRGEAVQNNSTGGISTNEKNDLLLSALHLLSINLKPENGSATGN